LELPEPHVQAMLEASLGGWRYQASENTRAPRWEPEALPRMRSFSRPTAWRSPAPTAREKSAALGTTAARSASGAALR